MWRNGGSKDCQMRKIAAMKKVALVAGATGLVGRELAKALLLLQSEWTSIYGIARCRDDNEGDDDLAMDPAYSFIDCDLQDREETLKKVAPLSGQVTHLFWVTWASQSPLDTPESCCLNRAMLSNVLDALLLSGDHPNVSSLAHVALQTGTNHYVSLRAPPIRGHSADNGFDCCYHYDEESPRVLVDGEPCSNFYYALEDLLEERLWKAIRWSVHRPGLLLGASKRSHFNFVGCLCVYGSICRHLALPLAFYGDRKCWELPYMDASDARLVADQLIWWASSSTDDHRDGDDNGEGQAFNAVNRITFTWKQIWPALACGFGCSKTMFSDEMTYKELMGSKGGAWEELVQKHGLRPTRMEELANWEFLDMVFRFPAKMLVGRDKAHRLGFSTTHGDDTAGSILYWVDRMRAERLIPPCPPRE